MEKSKKPPRRTTVPLVVGVDGRFGTPSAPCGPAPVMPTGVWNRAAAVPAGATEVAGSAGGAAGAAAGRAAGRACWALATGATSARPTTAVVPRRILRIQVLLIAGISGVDPQPLPPAGRRLGTPNTGAHGLRALPDYDHFSVLAATSQKGMTLLSHITVASTQQVALARRWPPPPPRGGARHVTGLMKCPPTPCRARGARVPTPPNAKRRAPARQGGFVSGIAATGKGNPPQAAAPAPRRAGRHGLPCST